MNNLVAEMLELKEMRGTFVTSIRKDSSEIPQSSPRIDRQLHAAPRSHRQASFSKHFFFSIFYSHFWTDFAQVWIKSIGKV